ncbi:dethiobiotin synthase [Methylomonas sp. AM2-LC]|uniref:dethiobiotin synthase n=1 Tax=Methylomonas sp. AM2-LC TaxID=3153301 RepID=UPI0032648C61
MASSFFITGTDTDIGKTWVTVALMRHFSQQGFNVAGMKPVAAGCEWRSGHWENNDALMLQQYATLPFTYQQINPYAFELPLSPHIACGEVMVEESRILSSYETMQSQVDRILVEGAGGWFSPLSQSLDNARLAQILRLPVIIVVGIRLGCINHARLTLQAVQAAGVECAGWVAVEIIPDRVDYQANVEYLRGCLHVPLLAEMPHMVVADFDVLASKFEMCI